MSDLWLPLGAYLIGSIPFSYLVVRIVNGIDIREVGSGNAGATNVLRAAGPPAALAVLALDLAKGALPAAVAVGWGARPVILSAVALAAVVGHMYPVYLGFRGGKGVATTLGVLAALELWPTVAAAAVMVCLIAWKRFVSLGSIVGVALLPLFLLWWRVELWPVALAAVIAILVVARHAGNIRRLRDGTERRLGEQMEVMR